MENKAKKSKVFSIKYLLFDFIRLTAVIPAILWFRTKRIYISKEAKGNFKGGCLLIANHSTFTDPVFLMVGIWERRHHFLVNKEIAEHNKFLRFLFRYCFLAIPIDKENFGVSTFKTIVSTLKSGQLVSIFPEGHVSRNGEIDGFKNGAVVMAKSAGVPIIPIYIKKRKNVFQRLVMVVGEPINVNRIISDGICKDTKEVSKYLEKKEEELKGLCENL